MRASSVSLLVTTGETSGLIAALTAHIAEGTRGKGLRRADVINGGASLGESAALGTGLAYDVLYREKYIDRQLLVRFESEAPLVNVHGRSADLAFALAFAAAALSSTGNTGDDAGTKFAVAATGMLGEDGSILAVSGLASKLAAAIAALPASALVLFPGANEGDLTADIRRHAELRNIKLQPVFRIEDALQRIGVAISSTWLESPFRGLEPFEFRHASIFFGRERQIEDALSLLARRAEAGQRTLQVLGPSGSGKSSLVLAGILPALLRRGLHGQPTLDGRWGLLRPRAVTADVDLEKELGSLNRALKMSWRHGDAAGLPRKNGIDTPDGSLDPDAFMAWLASQSPEPGRTRYIWVLDQMEEWFVGALQPATLSRFSTFLTEISRRGVWLIATLTSAAEPLLGRYPELAAIFGIEGRYVLSPQQGAGELEEVISGPARAASLTFQPGLEREIFAAASHGGPDVLPLLELLLTELYERRDPARNELRMEDYRAVGGLDGVISTRAEAVYQRLPETSQNLFPAFHWKLATNTELRPSDYSADSPMHTLIQGFQGKRLLVETRGADGHTGVHAAHEALFRHWPRAVEQRQKHESDIRLWLDLLRESGQWARGERALIPSGPQLAAARSVYERRASDWTASDVSVVNYLRASLHQHQRRQFLVAGAVGLPMIVASGFGLRAIYDYLESRHVTRIKFEKALLPEPNYYAPAAPFLIEFGVSISDQTPGSQVLIKSSAKHYSGRAVRSPFVMSQDTDVPHDISALPVSFTLSFDKPVNAVLITRAAFWAATDSGVVLPGWRADALDVNGKVIWQVAEPLFGSYFEVPARTVRLESKAGNVDAQSIHSVRIESDFRNELGEAWAAFRSVLIEEIQLVRL